MRISDWSSDVCSSDLEDRDVDAPLIFASGARAGPVDHDLTLAQAEQATIEERPAAKLRPGARTCGERAEQEQRLLLLPHDPFEILGDMCRIGCIQRRKSCRHQLLFAIESIATIATKMIAELQGAIGR